MEKRRVMSPVTLNTKLYKWSYYKDRFGPFNSAEFSVPFFVSVASTIALVITTFIAPSGPDRTESRTFILMAFGGLAAVTFGWAVLVVAVNFKAIINRGIVGNNLWVSRLSDLIPEHREIIGWVVPRGQMSYSHLSQCAIVIPLGGWFNKKPRIWYGPKYQFQDPKIYWHLGCFHPDPCNSSLTESTVTIKTRHGEETALFVGYALDLFNQMMADNPTPPVSTVGFALFQNMRAKVELEDKEEEQRAKIDELLDISTDTIRAIAASKRFGNKSKDGARIRKELTDKILGFLPADDPRRKMFEPVQSDA